MCVLHVGSQVRYMCVLHVGSHVCAACEVTGEGTCVCCMWGHR